MFDRLKKRADKILALDEKIIMQNIFSLPSMQTQIVDLNQRQLYEQGVQSDGTTTGSYSPVTVAYKQTIGDSWNLPGESSHITGNDTGETYRSMNVKSMPDGIVINADDRNNFFVREKKGLGLTNESKKELLPEIRERFVAEIKKAINS